MLSNLSPWLLSLLSWLLPYSIGWLYGRARGKQRAAEKYEPKLTAARNAIAGYQRLFQRLKK